MSDQTHQSQNVTVHSKLTVVSDTPVRPGKVYPLSALDHAMGLHTLHVVFYYRADKWGSSDLGRLRESLAEVLSYYPPVTGRLSKDSESGNWIVKCNDAGLRVLKAKVDVSIDRWLKGSSGCNERDLTVWEEQPEDPNTWSPFRVQMNDFEGGGLAIGLSCPHMHADPTCATLFLKSWTELYRRTSMAQQPFFHPHGLCGRANPSTDTKSVHYYETKSKTNLSSSTKLSTVTFRFSDAMIKKLHSDIQTRSPNATPFHILAALFWSSVTRAKNSSYEKHSSLSIGIDFRKLLQVPLPHGFFGNSLYFSKLESDVDAMKDGELGYVVEKVQEHLNNLTEEDYWSVIDWLESQKGEGGRFAPPFRMYGPELTCVNLEHLLSYKAVLEDMKPIHVSYHVGNVEGDGLILVLPSPEEGLGRTVIVSLPSDQIDMLCEDPAILQLKPTLLISEK